MITRIIYFICGLALALFGFSILGIDYTDHSIQRIAGISAVFLAGAYINRAFDQKFSSFNDLEEEKFFEIRTVTEEKEFFYYQVLQNGEVKHIRDVREFVVGTYIRSGKEITLRTGH